MKKFSILAAAIFLFTSATAFTYEVKSSSSSDSTVNDNWYTISGFGFTVPIEMQLINDPLSTFSPSISFDFLDVHEDTGFTMKSGLRLGTSLSTQLPAQTDPLAWGFHFDADIGLGLTIMPTDSFFFSLLGTARVMHNSFTHSESSNINYKITQEFSEWTYLFGGEVVVGFFRSNGSGTYISVAGGWVPAGDAKYGHRDENATSELLTLTKSKVHDSFAIIPTIGWVSKF